MKLVNNLTKATIKNHPCFQAAPEYNFEDDGNHFKGYIYTSPVGNGSIVITTLRSDDTTYLTVRSDYLENNFTREEWHKQPEAKLTDEFNGVDAIDIDKLIANCETILKAIKRLEAEVATEVIDVQPLKNALVDEALMIDSFIVNEVQPIDWLSFPDRQLAALKNYVSSLQDYRKRIKQLFDNIETVSRKEKRDAADRLAKYGYIIVDANNYWITRCKELIAANQAA